MKLFWTQGEAKAFVVLARRASELRELSELSELR